MRALLLLPVCSLMLVSACNGCASPATGGPGGPAQPGGEGEGEGEGDDAGVLSVSPGSAQLVVQDGVNPTQQYTATLAGDDVSASALWTVEPPALGTFSGSTFTSAGVGGVGHVVATLRGQRASADVRVRVVDTLEEPGAGAALPPNASGLVDAAPADDGRAPSVVYPSDGVLVPRNLGALEIHFLKGSDQNTLFAIDFHSALTDVRVLTRCTPLASGCLYTPSAQAWHLLSDSNAGLDAVAVTVRGTDDGGSGAGAAAPFHVSFSAAPVNGALYYWTTTSTAIMRVDFGALAQTPAQFFPFSGGGCFGCHALSPDGRKMSVSRDGINHGQLGLVDVQGGTEDLGFVDATREQFQSWDPSSSYFAAVFGDTDDLPTRNAIRIRDGQSGGVTDTVALDFEPDHPDWSPLGDRLTFTHVTEHHSSQRPGRGGIASVTRDASGAWGAPVDLVPAVDGKNRFTPATSPDGSYFVFVESTCASGTYGDDCDGDADRTSRLWAMPFDGSAPVELANADAAGALDGGGDLSNTYPKWAPFEQPRTAAGEGRVHWFTFSSRRHYGLRDSENKQWLWMVAVDPDKVLAGEDGSSPAFALPFQDLSTSNHMAQWARELIQVGCIDDGDACTPGEDTCCSTGATCQAQGGGDPVCVPGCVGSGNACETDADCCAGLCVGSGATKTCNVFAG